jgi:predicted amidohydrolase
MATRFKVACVQNCAGPEIEPNLKDTATLCREAAGEGAQLICLPEYFSCLDLKDNMVLGQPFPEESHPALARFRDLADELSVHLLLGSLAVETGEARFANRCYLLGPDGGVLARYDKIHLFDVDLPNGEIYRESGTVRPGGAAVLAPTPWGPLGLSVCYDLRFPMLYRSLAQAGAGMLAVPAAFTKTTGQAHWHVLMRARAIENGAYVFAPSQYGLHAGDRACYGHSLIVDPWGRVLADGGEGPGIISAEVDMAEVGKARGMIASLRHDRPFTPPQAEGSGEVAAE